MLYGKAERLARLAPSMFGGNMIRTVRQFESEWADLPARFEAGTPNTAGIAAAPRRQLSLVFEGLAAAMMVTASVRHARNVVRPIDVKGVWFGLPRSVLGFIAIAYVNARVTRELPGAWWIGVGVITAAWPSSTCATPRAPLRWWCGTNRWPRTCGPRPAFGSPVR